MALEDYRTYTELDAGGDPGHVVVAENAITVADMTANEDTRVHDDKDAAHFGANFEHDFQVNVSSSPTDAGGVPWAVSNDVDDGKSWADGTEEALFAFMSYKSTGFYLWIRDAEGSSFDRWNDSLNNTDYYCTVTRTGTVLELDIYTDVTRETNVSTETTTAPEGRSHQYAFGMNSWDANDAGEIDFVVANLDLKEAAGGLSIPIAMRHYLQMMGAG